MSSPGQTNKPHTAAKSPSELALDSSRELVGRRLGAAWRELVVLLDANLQQQAESAHAGESQPFLGGLRDKLRARAATVAGLLPQHWRQEFDTALREQPAANQPGGRELQLVDLGDLDEDLALHACARKVETCAADALYAVGRRVAWLCGKRRAGDVAAAAAPDIIVAALRRSLAAADFGLSERIELLRCMLQHAEGGFAAIYPEWNDHLKGLNILPELKRAYGSAEPSANPGGQTAGSRRVVGAELFGLLQGLVAPAGGAPAAATTGRKVDTAAALAALDRLQQAAPDLANDLVAQADSLRQFRASEIGQGLGQVDAMTVDIVAMLFDMIFQDQTIADPIKALIGRLQIPVLKVALADRSFFSTRAHPARRLLEQISRAAAQLGSGAGRRDPLYGRVALIIERLRRESNYDALVFDGLCFELETFLAEHGRAADAEAAAGVPLAEAQEQHLAALAAAEQALSPYMAEAPAAITELLGNEWRDLLARAHEAGDLGAWDEALATASDLLGSVRIAPGNSGRKTLVGLLPGLIRRIQEGFDRLDVDSERRLHLVDALFALHAALLSGDAAAAQRSRALAPASVEGAGAAALAEVAKLERGDWVEMAQGEGAAQRYRVSWVGPARGVLLLTNPALPRGIALPPQVLALRLERGQARIVPSEPLFERAVVRALRTFTDEQAAQVSLDFT